MTVERWDDAAAMDEMLSAYLDDDLAPKERESVRVALEGDDALRARYRDLAATVALLRDLPMPAPRRSFALTPEQARAPRPDFTIGATGVTGATDGAAQPFAAANAPPAMQPYAAAPAPAPMPSTAAMPARAQTAAPPGSVYPANVTPLRPRSSSLLARLVPLSGALSAVAAVLLFATLAIDFTGGRGGNNAAVLAPRSADNGALPEGMNTLTPLPTFAPVGTVPGGAARSNTSGAPNPGAPNPAAPAPAIAQAMQSAQPAQASAAAPISTVAAQPTAIAAPRAAPAASADDGPNALVRIAQTALALLLIAGIVGLVLGLRARQQIPTAS